MQAVNDEIITETIAGQGLCLNGSSPCNFQNPALNEAFILPELAFEKVELNH
jgi:hypothetical protein